MSNKSIPLGGLFNSLRHDVPASVVVFFVALPLCLGIALASGAPLFAGVIAGIVGGIVAGIISDSQLGVSGPAAGLTVIVLSAIQQLGSFEIFLLAVVLAGVIQLILGFIKAGVIAYFFPTSVIKGMLTAIGIIIILKQIPHAFGYDADYEGDMYFNQADGRNTFTELAYMLDSVTPGANVISVVTLCLLILWDKVLSKKHVAFTIIPGPLAAVIFGVLYQFITITVLPSWSLSAEHLVTVPQAQDVNDFLRQFNFPDFSQLFNEDIWIIAVTLALVASIETLLSVEATDKLDPYKRVTNTNRELLAQGVGNIVSGLIGGLPITQVIVRSSANIQSGARTKLSAIIHGFLLLIAVITIPRFLNMVPLAVLAGVLLVVGYKLAKPSVFKTMFRLGWSQFIPFMATIVGVVFTDLLKGIAIGAMVAIFYILRNSYRNSHFLHIDQHQDGGVVIRMTLAEEVIYLNKGAIRRELNHAPEGSRVIIDMSRSYAIDFDVLEAIEDFKEQAKSKNILVEVITKSTHRGTHQQPQAIQPAE